MGIKYIQKLCSMTFGSFETEELKKFIKLGAVSSSIIGSYWTLGTIKESLLSILVGAPMLPYAKLFSLLLLCPFLLIYTKLLDIVQRERLFYMLTFFYTAVTILFSFLIMNDTIGEASATLIAARQGWALWGTKVLGYAFYAFVESYGSIMIALFWAIAIDTTQPESAKKGFSFMVALGQFGGIFGPLCIIRLPRYFSCTTSGCAVLVTSGMVLSSFFLLRYFFKTTPPEFLQSFHGINEQEVIKKQEPGFLEGLRLLLQHTYLISIFLMSFFFEMITQVFDFHFKCLAAQQYCGLALAEYIGVYSTMVSAMTLVCLVLGINRIVRIFGIAVALALMPFLVGCGILGFVTVHHLSFLFWLMVGSKACNYSLNVPAIKQLFIPTTHDVRFKVQAWIETFGSRGARQGGSFYNMWLSTLQNTMGIYAGRMYHIMATAYFGLAFVVIWFFVALYLGRTCKKAVDSRTVIC